jgi:polyhydroxybutyrate depolymerase
MVRIDAWARLLVIALFVGVTAHLGMAGAYSEAAVRVSIPATLQLRKLVVGTTPRTYQLYVPKGGVREPVPLMIVLHGAGGSGARMHSYFGAAAVADRSGFAVAYPDGLNGQWNDGRPPSLRYLPQLQDVDDVGFIAAVVEELVTSRIADPRHIFIVGLSNGGGMALRMACDRPDAIAGFGFIAAPAGDLVIDACKGGRPLPMLFIHGTKDRTIPYAGGKIRSTALDQLLSAPEHAAFWAKRNGCLDVLAESELPDLDPADSTRVRRSVFQSCPAGAPVQLLTIEGGGHQSPIAKQDAAAGAGMGMLGSRSHDIDATEAMWMFRRASDRHRAAGLRESCRFASSILQVRSWRSPSATVSITESIIVAMPVFCSLRDMWARLWKSLMLVHTRACGLD